MTREKGTTAISSNFEVQKAAPLDARSLIKSYADLVSSDSWISSDGQSYAYKGMITVVTEDDDVYNNGIYQLMSLPTSTPENWIKIKSGIYEYQDLLNLPSINGITIENAQSSDAYGLATISSVDEVKKLFTISNNQIIKLTETQITTDGTYNLLDSVDNYDMVLVNFGSLFSDVKDSASMMSYTRSLIPHLSSNTSNPDYVLTADSRSHQDKAFNAFNGVATVGTVVWGPKITATSYSDNCWLTIQKLSSPIKTNMFTVYQGSYSNTYNYSTNHFQIKGSNDGETWDILVDDPVQYSKYESRVYYLEDYVEYNYIQWICIKGESRIESFGLREFLIQDTAIHKYIGKSSIIVEGDTAFDIEKGTVIVQETNAIVTNLTVPIYSIQGLLYNKATSYPIGAEIGWSGTSIPLGFLKLEGQKVPEEYPDLKILYPENLPNKPGFIIQALPQTKFSGGGGSGAELATNEEYKAGIITTKAPTVKQVVDDFNLIKVELQNYDTRISLLENESPVSDVFKLLKTEEGVYNLPLTIVSNTVSVPPFSAITSRGNTINKNNYTYQDAIENDKILYYDNTNDIVKACYTMNPTEEETKDKYIFSLDEISASSTVNSDHDISKAIDGDLETDWASGTSFSAIVGTWFRVKIPKNVSIASLEILGGLANRYGYEANFVTVNTLGVETIIDNFVSSNTEYYSLDLSNIDLSNIDYIKIVCTKALIADRVGITDIYIKLAVKNYLKITSNNLEFRITEFNNGNLVDNADLVALGSMIVDSDGVITSVIGNKLFDPSTTTIINLINSLESRITLIENN